MLSPLVFALTAACGAPATRDAGVAGSDPAAPAQTSSPSTGPSVIAVVGGGIHTCALTSLGGVRCWGDGFMGQLGHAAQDSVGAANFPASAGDVDVGGEVVQLTAGELHTCALLTSGDVRCWGAGSLGRLGYGDTLSVGAANKPSSVGPVSVGARVIQIAAGARHTCALTAAGGVRCWGDGSFGRLGYADCHDVGDTPARLPSTMGDVDVGGEVRAIAAGGDFTCALLASGGVRCWGYGGDGALGYASRTQVGGTLDSSPASAGDVDVGGRATSIAAGAAHACALLEDGGVVCWGLGSSGQLGHGTASSIGADETPSAGGRVDVGGRATAIAAGGFHTCAKLDTGNVRCWGAGDAGQLGYGRPDDVGELAGSVPSAMGDVPIGARVESIAAGTSHTCAVLAGGSLRCWGLGSAGQLGLGDRRNVGDDATPESVPTIAVF